MGRNLNKYLKKKIDSHKVISFDVFDTLIKRNCRKPTDIFYIVERVYNDSHKEKINDFHKKRIDAELKARQSHNNFEDVTLEQVYELIEYDVVVSNELKDIEIKTELKFCQKNYYMEEIYEYCKEHNKRVICISDMYLDADIIQEILEEAGYTELEKVYISSALNKTKYTGSLYDYVINDLNISRRDMLHIGDSKKADYLRPKLKGISSYLINRELDNCSNIKGETKDLTSNILYCFINNNSKKNTDIYYKLGYELLGPIVFAFCQWLHSQMEEMPDKTIFFCARDMQFTQRIFNLLYNDIKNEYIYISRASVGKPMLYKNNLFECFINTVAPKKILISEILKSKGIYIDNLDDLLKSYGIDYNIEYDNYTLNNDNFKCFYNDVISNYVEKDFAVEYTNFIKYMNSIGFDPNKAVLVDLGWNGTIQHSLQKIYGKKMIGRYFGLEPKIYKDLIGQVKGYLFSKDKNPELSNVFYSFRSLFEIFFLATHGTTLGYTGKDSEPVILGEYENLNNNIVDSVQKGAYDFAKNFKEYNENVKEMDISSIIEGLIKLGVNPTYNQAKIFGEFNFDNFICGKLASPRRMGYYIFHIQELKTDISRCEWKVAFLKRLFKIKLPYYSLYALLKKIQLKYKSLTNGVANE